MSKTFEQEIKRIMGDKYYEGAGTDFTAENIIDLFKNYANTIATKSAEESLKNWYFEGDELVITKGKWVIDRYKRNDL